MRRLEARAFADVPDLKSEHARDWTARYARARDGGASAEQARRDMRLGADVAARMERRYRKEQGGEADASQDD